MIFISHSNNDQGPFTGLCLALENERLPYWDSRTMKAGASLKDQLRDAITKCDVCIFIATRSSVDSKWCLAETGAFWGAGKRIILYQANPDIDELPPLFQGDLWACDVREVIRQAREELSEVKKKKQSQLRTSDGHSESRGEPISSESSNYDETDILILLENYVKSLKGYSHTLKFTSIDEQLELSSGTTKKYLSRVAANLGYKIMNEGGNLLHLEKDPPDPPRLIRA